VTDKISNGYEQLATQFEGVEYSAIRCTVCGAKMATHAKDHSCRMHRDQLGICMVCNDPYKNCFLTQRPCTGMNPGGCTFECRGNAHF